MEHKMNIFSAVFKWELFDLYSYGYYEGHQVFSPNILIYSLALTYHPKIQQLIKEKQEQLPNFPYPYPKEKDLKILYRIEEKLSEDVRDFVKIASLEILSKLELSKNWDNSIKVKIYTNILPIPYETFPFSFVEPNVKAFKNKKEKEEIIHSLKELTKPSFLEEAYEFIPRLENANYPFIAIKERLTRKKPLIDFINENFDTLIKPATEILPSRKHRKANLERFMYSVWFFDLLHNQNYKPKKIQELIEKVDPEQKMFGKYDVTSAGISKLADEARVKLGQIYPL